MADTDLIEHVVPANPAQVTDAQIEHMVQRFLGWRLPETFGPDAGIRFERVANAGTPYEFRHEPVGTNLFDYTEAKAMVQHMLEELPAAIGAGGQAVAVKPLDLSNLLKHAFSAGYVSAAGDDGWTDYDPTKCAAYSRILSAIAHPVQPGWRDEQR